MPESLDLVNETIAHLKEGARSVRAYSADQTYIITDAGENQFYVTVEEPGFPKHKTDSLKEIFAEVFGVEARY